MSDEIILKVSLYRKSVDMFKGKLGEYLKLSRGE